MLAGEIFQEFLILLASSVIVIALFRRLHLPPTLGYLVVGIFAGPSGPTWINGFHDIHVIAEFGIVFLLFTIGLEFSLPRLAAMKRTLLRMGSFQVLFCFIATAAIAAAMGMDIPTVFVISAAVSMSSTAVVSKLLAESNTLQTPSGRMSMGVLIFQDLAAIPFLIITTALQHSGDTAVLPYVSIELFKGAIAFSILLFIGHWIITPIFDEIAKARSAELFLLTALFIALAAGWFTDLLGLSMELGAFLAGVILGGTPYHHQVSVDIAPFRDTLLGLFFISIGMMINIHQLPDIGLYFLLIGLGIVVFKVIIITLVATIINRTPRDDALRTGLYLAQGGEFGFVLISLATQGNVLNEEHSQVLLGGVIVSMILSLFLIRYQEGVVNFISLLLPIKNKTSVRNAPLPPADVLSEHVVICGFGRVGQRLARTLELEGFSYLALDLDPQRISQASLAGERAYYGDATHLHTLKAAGLAKARALVISFKESQSVTKILQLVHYYAPKLPVLVRAEDDSELEAFMKEGATEVVPEALESSLMLGSHLLLMLGVPKYRVMRWQLEIRRNRYQLLRAFFPGEDEHEDIESSDQEREQLHSFYLPDESYAVGKTLQELSLEEYKITVTAIRRDGIRGAEPGPETRLRGQDVLVLYGVPEQVEKAEAILIGGPGTFLTPEG